MQSTQAQPAVDPSPVPKTLILCFMNYAKSSWGVAARDLRQARSTDIFGASSNLSGRAYRLRQTVGLLFYVGDLISVCRCIVHSTREVQGGGEAVLMTTCNVLPLESTYWALQLFEDTFISLLRLRRQWKTSVLSPFSHIKRLKRCVIDFGLSNLPHYIHEVKLIITYSCNGARKAIKSNEAEKT